MSLPPLSAYAARYLAGSYTLDGSDGTTIQSSDGSPADAFITSVAGLWDTLRHIDGAFALVVKGESRLAVATALTVFEGRAGLNVGLLLPSLRDLPRSAASTDAEPEVAKFADKYRQTVWDLAIRLGRVEAGRTFLLAVGDQKIHLHATRRGFSFGDGCSSVEDLLTQLRAATSAGSSVAYSLSDATDADTATYQPCALFAADSVQNRLAVGKDGWPLEVPAYTTMRTISALAAAVQRLNSDAAHEIVSVSLVDPTTRPMLSSTRLASNNGLALELLKTANGR